MSPVSITYPRVRFEIRWVDQISDVINQLFPGVGPARIATFSCGHIIPKENLRAVVMAKGPKGGDLVFNFNSRQDEDAVSHRRNISETNLTFFYKRR